MRAIDRDLIRGGVCVDGLVAEVLRFPGKPDPALFLEAARRLGVPPPRTILFEDALAGVEAGRRGGFGRVVGIDRGQQPDALRQHGADVIIKSLISQRSHNLSRLAALRNGAVA
jgi:beta-phosphoglucomutase-like phosphatase (HAD superfamily)